MWGGGLEEDSGFKTPNLPTMVI